MFIRALARGRVACNGWRYAPCGEVYKQPRRKKFTGLGSLVNEVSRVRKVCT